MLTAIDDNELTDMLVRIVKQLFDNPSEQFIIALSQCFMKDMSTQQDETEVREKIYLNWIQSMVERRSKV